MKPTAELPPKKELLGSASKQTLSILFPLTSPSHQFSLPEDYKGCFLDKPHRDLTGFSGKIKDMTPEKCFVKCAKLGFRYAGLQNTGQCFCGNNYNKYGSLPEKKCKCLCKGDDGETCGCEWSNKVYELRSEPTVCDEPDVCGTGAVCKVVNGLPECSCRPGISGDPKVRCCSKLLDSKSLETNLRRKGMVFRPGKILVSECIFHVFAICLR